jgi:sterol desaturase/sphingolipid hydroxylase (fatty acid hydroxylase superfamily)
MARTSIFIVRWLSYPVIFGGVAAAMVWLLYQNSPYWPSTAILAIFGIACVAGLERLQPFRQDWLYDHDDTLTDSIHLLVNLSVIQFTAIVLSRLGDMLPEELRGFPSAQPLWVQLLIVAAILDLSLYAMHRLSHHIPCCGGCTNHTIVQSGSTG